MKEMRRLAIAATVLSACTLLRTAEAQSTQPADLAGGKLLVASRDLPDPNFAKTVVLLVQYDEEGVVGLILNRRSKVPVSRVLNSLPGAKDRRDPVYAGGPVGSTDVLALVRSRQSPSDAKRVVGDVLLVSTKEALEKIFSSATDADAVHVYLGYSGWTESQLEHELDLGAWFIFPGSARAVFDSDPDSMWERLIRETELRIAFKRRAEGGVLPRPD
jgi:putative transcriptional regulator